MNVILLVVFFASLSIEAYNIHDQLARRDLENPIMANHMRTTMAPIDSVTHPLPQGRLFEDYRHPATSSATYEIPAANSKPYNEHLLSGPIAASLQQTKHNLAVGGVNSGHFIDGTVKRELVSPIDCSGIMCKPVVQTCTYRNGVCT
jgi:hypothetical protein